MEITLFNIRHLSELDCLLFQNWYSSEMCLYELSESGTGTAARAAAAGNTSVAPATEDSNASSTSDGKKVQVQVSSVSSATASASSSRAGNGRDRKLIFRSHRLVNKPHHENDQQSYFAIYRTQLDTTDFFP